MKKIITMTIKMIKIMTKITKREKNSLFFVAIIFYMVYNVFVFKG